MKNKNKLKSPREIVRDVGIDSISELSQMSGITRASLYQWSSNPRRTDALEALALGCAVKKHLDGDLGRLGELVKLDKQIKNLNNEESYHDW